MTTGHSSIGQQKSAASPPKLLCGLTRSLPASLVGCLVVLLATFGGEAVADDDAAWAALKEGGKVVLLRHTHVAIREGIGLLSPGNCAAEVNLSERGIDQARRLGEAFRAHGIKVGAVLTSPFCRCLDTGRLAFGYAKAVPYLRPPGIVSEEEAKANDEWVLQAILNHHGPAKLVMITHDLNIADQVLEPAAMGEVFVIRPRGKDFELVGKIETFE